MSAYCATFVEKMASNSKAVLADRVRELGLEDLLPAIEAKGWLTMGTIAFATTYVPTQPTDDLLKEQFIIPLIGDDVTRVPLLRRLWFECYSATMVEIKQRVAGGPESAHRKLTQPELNSRRAETKAKIRGLVLQGELDVSDDLINYFANMVTTQTIKYVPVEKSTKRELGIEGVTTDPHIVKDMAGLLKEVPGPKGTEVDTSTDLRIELALQRLWLAADMGYLMSFDKHEEMRLVLQHARLETPPPGYAPVSQAQTRNAHKEFWNQLSLKAQGRLTPIGGVKPLDAFVQETLTSRAFQACLMYLPAAHQVRTVAQPATGAAGSNGGQQGRMTKADKKRKKMEQELEAAKAEERAKFQRTNPAPGMGKGKSQGKGGGTSVVPRLLLALGCVARTPPGCSLAAPNANICFSYNFPGGCPNAQPGETCSRGLHVCAKCFGRHSASATH